MRSFWNVVKLIVSIIIIALVVLGIVMIIRNISSIGDAFNGGSQKVINATNGGVKQVRQVFSSIESIVF